MTDSHQFSDNRGVLGRLIQDPTRSVQQIAKGLRSYRQKVWREKKRMEKEKIIWGYTAVVDETKLNYYLHMMFLKMKPTDEKMAELIIHRLKNDRYQQRGIRVINKILVHGEFDFIIMFAAENHALARRYYDSIRLAYDEWLLEKPMIVDIDFLVIREGKINPNLKKIYECIPQT